MAAEAAAPEAAPAPLVFLTVGTDHHPFDRLVRWVDMWAADRDVRVVAQFGTAAAPLNVDGAPMLRSDELGRLMARAAAVVCHGGPGTIAAARDAGVIPIVVPRRPDLGEHVDDHQMRFVARLADAGAVHAPATEAELRELLDRALEDPTAFIRDDDDDAAAAEASVRRTRRRPPARSRAERARSGALHRGMGSQRQHVAGTTPRSGPRGVLGGRAARRVAARRDRGPAVWMRRDVPDVRAVA